MFKVFEKVIISGSILEAFYYHKAIQVSSLRSREMKTSDSKGTSFRRLINANSGQWLDEERNEMIMPKILTLTFAENIDDFDYANREFSKFVMRLNAFFFGKDKKLAYVAVPEFQKRGAIHYHVMIFNLPYIADVWVLLTEMWGHGWIDYSAVKKQNEAGWYMAKYMNKSFKDERLKGKKRYFSSRNLIRPIVTYDIHEICDYMSLVLSEPIYKVVFEGREDNTIEYYIYDISESPLSLIHKVVKDEENVNSSGLQQQLLPMSIQEELFEEGMKRIKDSEGVIPTL